MLKVLKQSVAMQNVIIFLLLNIFYLHIVKSLTLGHSSFIFSEFKAQILDNYLLVILTLLTVLLVSWVKRISALFLLFVIGWTTSISVKFYFVDYNKFSLMLIFFYLLTGGIFFLFWFIELEEPFYHPLYERHEIGNRNEFQINCILKIKGNEYNGYLSNWGESGCFCVINNLHSKHLRGKGKLEVLYGQKVYSAFIEICTEYDNGVGMVISDKKVDSIFTWSELFTILSDRGLNPKYSFA